MQKLIFYLIGIIVLSAYVAQINASKGSYLNSEELNELENSDAEGGFNLDKRPSWVVGKRIIEFKKDLDDQLALVEKYENNLREVKNFLQFQKSRELKRPAFYLPKL